MMTKIRKILLAALLTTTIGSGLFAFRVFSENQTSCPGTTICPIDGQVICKDQCPIGK